MSDDIVTAVIADFLAEKYLGSVRPGAAANNFISRHPDYFCTVFLRDGYCTFNAWVGPNQPDLQYCDPQFLEHLSETLRRCRAAAENRYGDATDKLIEDLRWHSDAY